MKCRGELLVGLSAAGFSLMPVFAKHAYAEGASVGSVLLLRFYLAIIFIWAYIFINKIDYKINKKQLGILALLGGVFYFGSSMALFSSYKYISAGLSVVLMFTYPAWVLIISCLGFKEKVQFSKIFAIIVSIFGVMLVSYGPGQNFNMVGIVLALVAAVSYALYVTIMGHKELKSINSMVMTGYILLFAALTFTFKGVFIDGGIHFSFSMAAWINIMLLAFISTSVAILAFCIGVKEIGSTRAAIISTVEPIMTFIFGYIFLGEGLNVNMVIGALLIIGAVTFINVFDGDEKGKEIKEAV